MVSKVKKVSSEKGCEVNSCSYSPTVYIDFDDLKEIKGLEIGQEVRVVLCGTVNSLEQRASYEDSEKPRASISLRDFEAEIVDDSSKFAALLEDEDD